MWRNVWLGVSGASLLWACGGGMGSGTASAPDLAFEKYRLANGLEVILAEDKRLPMVAVNLWYHAGPANERPGRTGFAHLFEHMMFQGSKHIGNDRHFQLLEAAGASDINGTTDFDRTNYYETLPSSELELALWVESDRMGYLLDTLDQEKLSGQIDVVRNERRQSVENAPYGLADEEVFHQLFPKGHPYYASIIGSHTDLEAVKLADVRDFFREYYAPNNASLAIVGDIDKAKTKALVEKYFGPLAAGKAVEKPAVATPAITAERRAIVTDKVELPRVLISWITAPIFQPGDAEADLLAVLLGGGKSSRLYKKLVYELQIAQDVSALQYSLTLGSVFQIQATARPGVKVEDLERAIDSELAALQSSGPSKEELARARNKLQTSLITGLEVLGGVADTLNRYNHHVGDPGYLKKDFARYSKATVADLKRVAQQALAKNARVVVHAIPGEKKLEDVPGTQRAVMAAAAATAVTAVPESAAPTSADLPAGAQGIDDSWRATQPATGAASALSLPTPQQLKLPNGLSVMLVEQHQLPVVAASLVVLRGSEANPADKPGLAAFAADMLDEGTRTRGTLQLADDVAQIGASLSSASSMDFSSVSVSALRGNAARAFELLADAALNPAFDDKELERLRTERLTTLLQERDSPTAISSRVFSRVVYGAGHPYGFPEIGTEAALKTLTRDDLQAFWSAGYTPGNSALVLSGDLTLDQARELATRYFGEWRGESVATTLPAVTAEARRQKIVIVDKPRAPQTSLRVGLVGLPRSSPDYVPAEVMGNALTGLFSSRINMNLREQHGYTYGAGGGFSFRRGPGPFRISSSVRADATAPAVGEIFKEIERMRATPISATELATARDSFARSLPGLFETTTQSVGSVAQLFAYGLPLDYYRELPASINQVTVEEVQRLAQSTLTPSQMTVVAVGDQASIMAPLARLRLGDTEVRDASGEPIAGGAGK